VSTDPSVEALDEALHYAQAHSLKLRVSVAPFKGRIVIAVDDCCKRGYGEDLDFAEAWSSYLADLDKKCELKASWDAKALYELFSLASEKEVRLSLVADFSKYAGNVFKAETRRSQPKAMHGKKLHSNAETAAATALDQVAAL
jgi:hypothetical protein